MDGNIPLDNIARFVCLARAASTSSAFDVGWRDLFSLYIAHTALPPSTPAEEIGAVLKEGAGIREPRQRSGHEPKKEAKDMRADQFGSVTRPTRRRLIT